MNAYKELNHNIINALNSLYYVMYEINLENYTCKEIITVPVLRDALSDESDAKELLNTICNRFCMPDYRSRLAVFFDMDSFSRRLEKNKVLIFEYQAVTVQWAMVSILPLEYNERGKIKSVVLAVRDISDAKERDSHYQNLIQALAAPYSNLYTINMEDGSIQIHHAERNIRETYGDAISDRGYEDALTLYIDSEVYEDDKYLFDPIRTLEGCRQIFAKSKEYAFNYRIFRNGAMHDYAAQLVKPSEQREEFALGFRNVDDEVNAQREQRRILEEQMAVVAGLAADYYSVMLVDYQEDKVTIRTAREEDGKQIADFFSAYDTWSEGIKAYTDTQVAECEKERFYDALSLDAIRNRKEDYTSNYQKVTSKGIVHLQFKVAYVKSKNKQHFAVVGTRNVEKEFQNQIELQQTRDELEIRYSMIVGLSHEYHTVWLIPQSGENMQLFRSTGKTTIQNAVNMGLTIPSYNEALKKYIDTYVDDADKERVWNACRFEAVLKNTPENNIYAVNYMRHADDGKSGYHQMAFARATKQDGSYDIIMGFRDVDDIVREEQEKQQALRDALAAAEHANHAKTTFLSNMSHDIRTPMNAIMGFTTLAMTHIDNQNLVADYLGKIVTSSNHLLSLINDVLDMSRIESGRMHLEEAECNLSEILHNLRNILLSDLKARNLDFYIDTVDVFDERVICDKLRLNQILLNVVGNAVKFTECGGSISIRLIQKPSSSVEYANYEFRVKDTGIGMSKDFIEHIFEPFERERTSTLSGIQGTGLGMAITKNIVDLMNGTITVESEQGKGTEFVFTVPMKKLDTKPKNYVVEELKGAHALVVDDDFNTCDSVTTMLIQMGMRADWCMNGKESVLRSRQATKRNDPYRVYVIDWLIPDMNGVEIARNIRREVGEDASIIILTAYDWGEIEDEARAAGVTAFISKPLFISDVRRCLMDILHPQSKQQNESAELLAERMMGKRLLLIEDNDLNREIASELLSSVGLVVEEAIDGATAVKQIEEKGAGYYDAVLMDVQMPVMDGYEATRRIRALHDKKIASIPIIAMTANAFAEDIQRSLEAGMNGHIAKPFQMDKLLTMLGSVI